MMTNNNPSSIGEVGIIDINEGNDRVRVAMHHEVLNTQVRLNELLTQCSLCLKESSIDNDLGRITVRFLTTMNLDQCTKATGGLLEAYIPLGGSFAGYGIAYVAKNGEARAVNERHLVQAKQDEIRTGAQERSTPLYQEISYTFDQEHGEVFQREILTNVTDALVSDVVNVYTGSYYNEQTKEVEYCFQLNTHNVREMLDSGENIVSIIKDVSGRVVSIAIGELMVAEIEHEGVTKKIRMMEISDTATLVERDVNGNMTKSYGGLGLNTIAVCDVIKQAYDTYGDELDVVYGECRSILSSVNYLARKTGRIYRGTLRDSVKIGGILDAQDANAEYVQHVQNHPYGDLNVMALNNDELREIYGE